ncbi:MAG: cytochrome P450 [Actinomycetota bacterium]
MQLGTAARRSSRRLPDGPSAPPLVGLQLAILRRPLELLEGIHREYGDLVSVPLFGRRAVGVFAAQEVRKVKVAYGDEIDITSSVGRDLNLLRFSIQGRGPLNAQSGQEHLRYREICRRSMAQTMDSSAAIAAEHARRLTESWPVGGEIDLVPHMHALSRRTFKHYMFGTDVTETDPELSDAVDLYVSTMTSIRRFLGASMIRRDVPGVSKGGTLRRGMALVDAAIEEIVAGTRTTREPSLAAAMMQEIERLNEAPDASLARELMLQMFYAGIWSVPANYCWTLMLLALHPKAAGRLIDELEATLGGDMPVMQTRLPFLDAVLMESMRLYAGVYDFRKTTAALHVDGYEIPPKTTILLSPWLTQRSPRSFTHPDIFDPDRFADPTHAHPDGAFDPWGFGNLSCVGRHIARQSQRTVISTIVQRVRLDVLPGQHVDPVSVPMGIAALPSPGIRMRVQAQDGDVERSATTVQGTIVGAAPGPGRARG